MKQFFSARWWLFLIAPFLIALGFLRDFIFKNINFQLSYLWNKMPISEMDGRLSFLSSLSYWDLYYFKWILTGLFTLLFFFLSLWVIHLIYKNRSFLSYVIWSYFLLVIVAILFFTGGSILGNANKGYTIARVFMGAAQSPLVMLVLIIGLRLVPPTQGQGHKP